MHGDSGHLPANSSVTNVLEVHNTKAVPQPSSRRNNNMSSRSWFWYSASHDTISTTDSLWGRSGGGATSKEEHYFIHQNPKESVCLRCCCPDDSLTTFPRGARLSVCLGVIMLAGIIFTILFPFHHHTTSNKSDRYNRKAPAFNPDLSPTHRPTLQPTIGPTNMPVQLIPTPSPTLSSAPTIENVNPPGSIVSKYGWLQVTDGTDGPARIVKENGATCQLRGMSLFWSNTGWGAEKFWSKDVVRILVEDWKIDVIRAAVGVEDEGGFLHDSDANWDRLIEVVDAALEFGIYVIIDWHSHYATQSTDRAVSFFYYVSSIYGRYPNILYEIFNEPIDQDWATEIKPYSELLISTIRQSSPRGLILIGTPFYSQEIDEATSNPILGWSNLVYVFHFYAGSHRSEIRQKVQGALDNGAPVICSEFGAVNANGDGAIDAASLQEWMDFMNAHDISWLNWAVSDADESTSILKNAAYLPSFDFAWPDADLTSSGLLIKSYLLDD